MSLPYQLEGRMANESMENIRMYRQAVETMADRYGPKITIKNADTPKGTSGNKDYAAYLHPL